MERIYDKITIENINSVDDVSARAIGQYYELYSSRIRNLMTVDFETSKRFGLEYLTRRTIKRYENINDQDNATMGEIRKSFLRDLVPPPDAVSESHPKHFLYNYYMRVRNFTIGGLSDLEYIYKESCKFLGKCRAYGKEIDDSYYPIKMARVVLFDILCVVVNATEMLYDFYAPESVNEIISSSFRYFKVLKQMVKSNLNGKIVMDFAYVLSYFYDKHGFSHETFFNGSKEEDPFLLLIEDKIRSSNMELMDVLSAYMNYYKAGIIRETTLDTLDRVYESKRKDLYFESGETVGEVNNDIIIFGDKSIADSITSRGLEYLKMDLYRFNQDMVKTYMTNVVEPCVIDFNIHEQLKMYIQVELECKLLAAMIKNNDVSTMFTIMNYEGDNFVLFTSSNDKDVLMGLTINEEPDSKERKIITIDKDEDISYQFTINDEEV